MKLSCAIGSLAVWLYWTSPAFCDSNLEANIEHSIKEAEKALQSHKVDLLSVEEDVEARLEATQRHIDQAIELRKQLDAEAEVWNKQQLENLALRLEEVAAAEQRRREYEKNSTSAAAEVINDNMTKLQKNAESNLSTTISSWFEEEVSKINFQALEPPSCSKGSDVGQYVHEALNSFRTDDVGKTDLLQQRGTKIIHQLTSETFSPPLSRTLGMYSNLIPVDWIALLPEDWPNWPVPTIIPDHIWHSLGMAGTTAPPEAILQASTAPGSCWASHHPRVTIQLSSPAAVSHISIDHASGLVLDDRSSAPKKLRFVGYAPCPGDCSGLSFDQTTQTFFSEVQFEINAQSSIQSFKIDNLPRYAPSEDASCSTATPQCEAPDLFTAAISVEVTDNWGNPDYTCLYRVRVHGEQVLQ